MGLCRLTGVYLSRKRAGWAQAHPKRFGVGGLGRRTLLRLKGNPSNSALSAKIEAQRAGRLQWRFHCSYSHRPGQDPLIWRIGRLQVKYHLHLSITPSLRFHTIRSKSRTRAVMAKTRLWRTRCHSSELEMPAQPGPKRKPVKGARVREDMAPKSRLFASSRCRHQRSLSTACV